MKCMLQVYGIVVLQTISFLFNAHNHEKRYFETNSPCPFWASPQCHLCSVGSDTTGASRGASVAQLSVTPDLLDFWFDAQWFGPLSSLLPDFSSPYSPPCFSLHFYSLLQQPITSLSCYFQLSSGLGINLPLTNRLLISD